MTTDWDDAYSNAAYIPEAEQIVNALIQDAADFQQKTKDQSKAEFDIPYGDRRREKYDLFYPEDTPKGLVVFVHGGYWIEFDKSSWSHLAAGCVAQGWAVCLPSYDLCPDVKISDITKQVGAAITAAAQKISGPIHISGHSAGGHLAVRMGCNNTPLSKEVTDRINRIVGISGMYDLHPLRLTSMNKDLKIEEADSKSESPALLTPLSHISFTAWVGAAERPEFLRQSKLLYDNWAQQGAHIDHIEAASKHHFDVILPLVDANSDLVKKLVG